MKTTQNDSKRFKFFVLILIFATATSVSSCKKFDSSKNSTVPISNANASSEIPAIQVLQNEVAAFNQRVIDLDVNIDSLQIYYQTGNIERINFFAWI